VKGKQNKEIAGEESGEANEAISATERDENAILFKHLKSWIF